ncbi:syntaxin-6 isoform X2 [Hyposmocoma kahamanoa]|uniref:syntaxin-6 isoform X1 n=1 Tax=Hyposmocoma kahamanoa TaxID=1477025 RepID=UPI000E6D772C|nr:syntaxin-6 isoform X1 [Hyposmocoma kahamanoa]XP_026316875.1 syntaxin-6 isoform X2 [Hyposmocoma kahamanoa]
MTLEDPFYVVKDEVFKALNKTRGLYLRWQEISKTPSIPNSPEAEWTSTELRNALRSIEWDLEDLEDTISIVEKNSSKFKIDNKEICDRKTFIQATKQEVKVMKSKMSLNRNRDNDGTAREPLLGEESPMHFGNLWTSTPKYSKYSKLANQTDSPNRLFDTYDNDIMSMQDKMISSQNDQLQVISNSVGSLKTVSKQIGIELDEQAMMLDDLNTELENADSKLDSTIKKVAKVLHMNNDQRQCLAILILVGLLMIILILFIIL